MSDSTMSVRNDLQPVVIGGDIGAYALGREMHEAFGVKSYCVAPSPIGAIAHSAIFEQYPVERLAREQIRGSGRHTWDRTYDLPGLSYAPFLV